MLIVHIKTSSARISKHFRIHHRTLGSILNEDLHHGLIDIGTLCILIKSDSQHDSDTQEVEPPESKKVVKEIK